MKIEHLTTPKGASEILANFLDADRSGEVFSLAELAEKLPQINVESRSIRSANPKLRGYTLKAATKGGGMRLFYGNPAVVERAKKYIREKK